MLYCVFFFTPCIALWTTFPATGSAKPPNEWGTYYSLPSGHATIDVAFSEVFAAYVNSKNSKTQCESNEADFERWYVSSVNSQHYLLSYYCRTKAVRGYEHLKVDISRLNVLDFQTSLKGFNIMDAGDYEEDIVEKDGKKLEAELLNAVKDNIEEQRHDSATKTEYCPNPGTQTLYDMQKKQENGLHYYKIAISCNVTQTPGYASHMTHIEVVVDKDFKVLNDGKPVLATMEYPQRNSAFIRVQDRKAEKRKGACEKNAPGFISFIPVMWISYLKLSA